MTLLAELFELLESEPEKSGICNEKTDKPTASASVVKVAALAPEPPQATAAAPAAPTPAPAEERPAEAHRNAWTITRGGKSVCTICGAPMTYSEALAEARWRWPDAAILES